MVGVILNFREIVFSQLPAFSGNGSNVVIGGIAYSPLPPPF